jgi:hypothetical protein
MGPCEKCRKIVNITFKYAPYDFNSNMIPYILQGVCDECGGLVSLPHQSSFKIKEFKTN